MLARTHLLNVQDLTQDEILAILTLAQSIYQKKQHLTPRLHTLNGKTVINLFFESSTRTRVSFELAAKRLGATVINIDLTQSALCKGESLLDMLYTLQAMQCHFFIVRHRENGIPQYLAQHSEASIINAGDGTHAHPSQALLDMLTIQQHKPNFTELSVAIIGDIRHSRVANSQIAALHTLGVKNIRLIAPPNLLPETPPKNTQITTNIQHGLAGVDVVITLRVQKERMIASAIPNTTAYHQMYGLTQQRLALAKPDALVLHPGPINRGVEITNKIADGPQSLIRQQVTNGIAVRMAIFTILNQQEKPT